MACCTQKDFYEASQLHLFRSVSIKLAEALAARANGHGAGDREKQRRGTSQRAGSETNNKKRWRKTCVAWTDERAAAGGISVRGAFLNFCQQNSFQMHRFPAWPHPVQMPSLPAEPPQIGHAGANRGIPIFLKGNF